MKSIFKGRNRKRADIIMLILASQSISATLEKQGDGTWEIRVAAPEAPRALKQISAYDRENRPLFRELQKLHPSTFSAPAIFCLIAFLGLIHFLCTTTGYHDRAVFALGASPYFLEQGETFRAVTALFMHSDTRHLMGNMAGFIVLGSPLVRLTGTGPGLFLLLCAGTTGNLISAGLGQGLRLSIGASTAVMGAAGLLAAGRMLSPSRRHMFSPPAAVPTLSALAPLAAAATLVAMFSHGEQTDVSAHLFGFLSGVIIGLGALPLLKVCEGPAMERICLALTLGIVLAAAFQGVNQGFN
ncbi:MAG: rhomboid family intramembrane serine protease [Desulfobacter sp.]|nr:MAG: rhomboid family intramembrane serine protease [Desulfobacter sp.]